MRFIDQVAAEPGSIPHLNDRYLAAEEALVRELTDAADPGDGAREKIQGTAARLVRAVRKSIANDGGIDAFLQQYDLSSQEGVLLMCIAEALLRIPDGATADKLIADKITSAQWKDHLGESDSLFVNASTWGIMLTGHLLKLDDDAQKNPMQVMSKLASRAGEPVVRTAMKQAMRIRGHHVVMGRTIEEALKRAVNKQNRAYRYSFDMLGEAALTAADARRYFDSYGKAIGKIGIGPQGEAEDIFAAPSISVKLSALHPRFSYLQSDRVMSELVPLVVELAEHAKASGIALTIDSEEADRLDITMQVFAQVMRDAKLGG